MKKILVVVLALAMIVALAACGEGGSSDNGASSDPNVGVYTGTSVEMMGITMDMSEIYDGDCTLDLKDGGKATVTLDGQAIDATWAVDGDAITVTIEGEESAGTITDGTIVLDLMNMGMNMTFVK